MAGIVSCLKYRFVPTIPVLTHLPPEVGTRLRIHRPALTGLSWFPTSVISHSCPNGRMTTTHALIFSSSIPGSASSVFPPSIICQGSLSPDSHFPYTAFPDHPVRTKSFLTQFYISIIILFKFNFHFFAN